MIKTRTPFLFNKFYLLENTKEKQTEKLARLIHPREAILLRSITVSFAIFSLIRRGSAIVHIAKEDIIKAQVIFSNDFEFLYKI